MKQMWKSPAKLNLYLAVTGIRESDGFHSLDSLVTLLDFGDDLFLEVMERGDQDDWECSDARLKWDDSNLLRRAADLYRSRTDFRPVLRVQLEKRIPMGAGLGGGSSNASTLLLALNSLNPRPVDLSTLLVWSAELGSDCPLFLSQGLIRMRGRGERVETIDSPLLQVLQQKKILLCHPGFGIAASWAYQQLRRGYPAGYTQPIVAAREIENWLVGANPWKTDHRNDLGTVVDRKYLPIPMLREQVERAFGTPFLMSGSGSACFMILDEDQDAIPIQETIRSCWGDECFLRLCHLARV